MTIYDAGPYVPLALVLLAGLTGWAVAELLIFASRSRSLRRAVFANLDSAYEGGYFEPGEYLHGATACGVAFDLRAFAEDMLDYTPTQLKPHVQAWLDQKGLS